MKPSTAVQLITKKGARIIDVIVTPQGATVYIEHGNVIHAIETQQGDPQQEPARLALIGLTRKELNL